MYVRNRFSSNVMTDAIARSRTSNPQKLWPNLAGLPDEAEAVTANTGRKNQRISALANKGGEYPKLFHAECQIATREP